MCGIMGVLGKRGAARLVQDGLRSLEYRGYDSCGIAWVRDGIQAVRAVGTVDGLEVPRETGTVALGHTRWATHGGVTEANAHPHLDNAGKVAVVHNGVLLNHLELRRDLQERGHVFHSETDSENLAHLWADQEDPDPWKRLATIRRALQGTYSVALLDEEGAIHIAKERNPLWVARGKDCTVFASDPIALRQHTEWAIPLEDGDHGRLTAEGIELRDARGRPVQRQAQDIRHLDDRVDKAGYEHYMLKEIHETPAAMNRVLAAHLRQGRPYVELSLPRPFLRRVRRAVALGAGTSYHAGLLGTLYLQRLARLPAQARPTPEYKDDLDVPEDGALLIAMSQSGETLDTLQALHRLRSHPHPTLALTNHPSSSIGRHADHVLALRSGAEISVAATKTFLSQSLLMYLLALAKARVDHTLGDAALSHAARELITLPRAIERTLLRTNEAMRMGRRVAEFDDLFILAKGLLLPAALEAALKLKEIAYQHAEAYPAGELKHGPFALLTPETAVLFLLAPGPQEASVRNSMHEVHARGAPTLVVAMEGAEDPGGAADLVYWIPQVEPDLQPFVFACALHQVSYWTAKARGLPIDRPRNLAKSVTVE